MATFDKTLPSGVGLYDFSIYASPKAILGHPEWPVRLVTQPDIKLAFAIEAKLETGWLPGEDELANAPTLDEWYVADLRGGRQGVYLRGFVTKHPVVGDARTFVETSHVVALDTANHGWARTLSRWYRLGRPA